MLSYQKISLFLLLSGALLACNKNQSLGGLPDVSVPLGKAPPPREQPKQVEEKAEPIESDPPDPEAMRTSEQRELHLAFQKGEVVLLDVKERHYERPRLTPRNMGRFAVEFWIGQELLERVRFNFPLLGSNDDDASLESGLSTTAELEVPVVPRATRARILDRQSRREWLLPLPLNAGASTVAQSQPEEAAPPEEASPPEAAEEGERTQAAPPEEAAEEGGPGATTEAPASPPAEETP